MSNVELLAKQLKHVKLEDGETIADAWVAGIAWGKKSNGTKVGGTLVLTDRRVIFLPLKLSRSLAGQLDQAWIDGSAFNLRLGDVRSIEVDANRRSALVVKGPEGTMALNIGASRAATPWSKKSIATRDAAVVRINESIAEQSN